MEPQLTTALVYAQPAFYECMYYHYQELSKRAITTDQHFFYRQQQFYYACSYINCFMPKNHTFFKILNFVKMKGTTFFWPEDILHMAKLIEKYELLNEPLTLHVNQERIALKDSNQVVKAWLKPRAVITANCSTV